MSVRAVPETSQTSYPINEILRRLLLTISFLPSLNEYPSVLWKETLLSRVDPGKTEGHGPLNASRVISFPALTVDRPSSVSTTICRILCVPSGGVLNGSGFIVTTVRTLWEQVLYYYSECVSGRKDIFVTLSDSLKMNLAYRPMIPLVHKFPRTNLRFNQGESRYNLLLRFSFGERETLSSILRDD